MVQEYIGDMVNIDKKDQLIKEKYNLKEVSNLLSDCFCRQIFYYGIIHGDPHGGNVFVRKINSKITGRPITQLVLIDHGIYKYLTDELRLGYSLMWHGLISQNEDIIKDASERLGVGNRHRFFASMVSRRNWLQIMAQDGGDTKSRFKGSKSERSIMQENTLKYRNQIASC